MLILLWLLIGLIWAGVVAYLHYYRIWLFYYLLAVGGGAALTVLIMHQIAGFDSLLSISVAWVVHILSGWFGLPTHTFDGTPGTLLVMIIDQSIGWTALQIGVESSGLLELCALLHILLWYPGWQPKQRIQMIGIGLVATWVANIMRVLFIVAALHMFGKPALVIAHTYLGKALFFFAVVGIGWWTVTATTLQRLGSANKTS